MRRALLFVSSLAAVGIVMVLGFLVLAFVRHLGRRYPLDFTMGLMVFRLTGVVLFSGATLVGAVTAFERGQEGPPAALDPASRLCSRVLDVCGALTIGFVVAFVISMGKPFAWPGEGSGAWLRRAHIVDELLLYGILLLIAVPILQSSQRALSLFGRIRLHPASVAFTCVALGLLASMFAMPGQWPHDAPFLRPGERAIPYAVGLFREGPLRMSGAVFLVVVLLVRLWPARARI